MSLTCDDGVKPSKRRARGKSQGDDTYQPIFSINTVGAPYPDEVGMWCILLYNGRQEARALGCRNPFKIERHADNPDTRVLSVHRMIHAQMNELLDSMISHQEQCGCLDCFGAENPVRAMRTFAKRRWDYVSYADRAIWVANNNLPSRFIRSGPEIFDEIEDAFAMYEIGA